MTPWVHNDAFVHVVGVGFTIHLGMIELCWLLFLASICDDLKDVIRTVHGLQRADSKQHVVIDLRKRKDQARE